MTKAYLLFFDTDYGSKEEWNIFYTPVEVYSTLAAREARKKEITAINPAYQFHTMDIQVNTPDNDAVNPPEEE